MTKRNDDLKYSEQNQIPIEMQNEILKDLPNELRAELKKDPEAINQIAFKISKMRVYEGPIPSPQLLSEYKKVDSTFPKRIFEMAENQSKHRQKLEEKVISSNIASERVGQIMAFILCISAIIGGIFLLYNDKSTAGFSVLLGSLMSVAGAFLYSNRKQHEEIKDNNKKMLSNKMDSKE